jgi:hypothetical protein
MLCLAPPSPAVLTVAIMNRDKERDARFAARTAELIEAFVWFRETLGEAFAYGADEPRSPENERKRLAAGLVVVAQFVRIFDPKIAGRFGELGSALGDIDDGIVRPLLMPVKRRGALSSDVWRDRARLALALHALMRTRNYETENDAAAEVLKSRKFKIKANTLIGWRKDFMEAPRQEQPRIPNSEGRALFDLGRAFVERVPISKLKGIADDMIAQACEGQ